MKLKNITQLIALSMVTAFAIGCGEEFADYSDGDESIEASGDELRAESSGRRESNRRAVGVRDAGDDEAQEFELVPCERPAPRRGLVCLGGFWTTGDRCHNDRSCPGETVCLAPRDPHCYLVAPEADSIECPEGSFGPDTPILCAPGFEPELVTRDGCTECVPVTEECGAVQRCREAELSIRECIIAHVGSTQRARTLLRRAATVDLSGGDILRIIACSADVGDDDVVDRPGSRRRSSGGERPAR